MKQSRKEFIKRAHESACSNWKIEIEKEFPKLCAESKLEVGKWYKTISGSIVNYQGGNSGYGITYIGGNWYNNDGWGFETVSYKPATDKEVEEALIKEAKKRGFKEGVSVKCLDDGRIWDADSEFSFDSQGRLGTGAAFIFIDGKWATIIDQPKKLTVEEVEKKLGYKVEIIS